MINNETKAPASPPEAAASVLLPPSVTFATGCVRAFQDIVEPSDKVCSGLKAALVNLLYPPSLNSTNEVPSL